MKALLILLSVFSLTPLHADVFKGPQSSALGGSGSAGMPGAESMFLNPALIPTSRASGIDFYYRDGYADYGQHRQAFGLGAIDTAPDVWFPGGLHYLRLRETGRSVQPASGELIQAAVGDQIGRVAVGVSFYRLSWDVKNDRNYIQYNGSLGLLYMHTDSLGFAYVLKNMAGPGSDVPLGLREDMQQTVGVFAGLTETARLRFDIARQERFNPDKKMAYMFGIETKTNDLVVVRLGYRLDDFARQRVWTAGAGFDGPRLKVDYSLEKTQERTPGALHSVDLRLVF